MSTDNRRWFEQRKDFVTTPRAADADAPEAAATAPAESPDLFTKCASCCEPLYSDVLATNLGVCHLCGHHFRLGAIERLRALCDDAPTVVLHDSELAPVDALSFVDTKSYANRIVAARAKTGRNDAFVSVAGPVGGVDCEIGAFDFGYMGGSMGSVVGEKITRLYERAAARRVPAIVISSSGGARMQEGVLSLMQMAKTCAALARLEDEGLPFISVLTHPTTGGVAASFAMLGHVILAEPAALIGFAGPRVIRETIGQELPDDFQTSEYLLAHGMVDAIVPRAQLKGTVVRLMRQFMGLPPAKAEDALQPGTRAGVEGSLDKGSLDKTPGVAG